jgi:hypothetical protein
VHIFTVQTIFTVCGSTDDWLELRQVGKHNRESGRKLMTRIPNRNIFTQFFNEVHLGRSLIKPLFDRREIEEEKRGGKVKHGN